MKKIIVISHAPCSSGTFLSHWIFNKLPKNSWFIPETSAFFASKLSPKSNYFHSPYLSLQSNSYIPFHEWKSYYSHEINSIVLRWEQDFSSPYLFIRDWAYPEYFINNNHVVAIPNIAHILSNYRDKTFYILSHRDPIDCWLGLHSSFPKQARNSSIDRYSCSYLEMTKSWEMLDRDHYFLSIKLESLTKFKDIKSELFKFIGVNNISQNDLISEISYNSLTSGASGRKYSKLTIPARRTISFEGVSKLNSSKKLSELRSYLQYLDICRPTSASFIGSFTKKITDYVEYLHSPGDPRCNRILKNLGKIGFTLF